MIAYRFPFPFGKHRGKSLDEIPRSYLLWLATLDNIWDDLRDGVFHELSRRGIPFGRYKDIPLSEVPTQYLEWLLDRDDIIPPLDKVLEMEMERRDR